MSPSQTIAIIGATGTQGASVANTFLALPGWHVRAIARNTTSEKARSLAAAGAQVVTADLGDVASLERAFTGAHVIFVNTDFWALYHSLASTTEASKTEARETALAAEIQHARNAAAAASSRAVLPTLQRYVYSALGPMARASGGKYVESYHWEGKAAAVDHISAHVPELAAKTSFVYMGCYADNKFLLPKRGSAGEGGPYELVVPCGPDARMPIIDVAASAGPFVRALLDEPAGTSLLACDADLPFREIVAAWERVTGDKAVLRSLSMDEMRRETGLPDEVLQGAAFIGEYHYMAGVEGWIAPHELRNPPTTRSYEEYLRAQSRDVLMGTQFDKF